MNKNILPGLAVATLLGIVGILLSKHVPYTGAVSLALVLGIIAGNSLKNKQLYSPGVSFADKKLLPFTIALMGIELKPGTLMELGYGTIALIVIIVATVILSGYLSSKIFGFSRKNGILLGCGNAICGSSAVLSVTKVINGNEEETGLSVAAVNFMGTIGLFVLPVIALAIGFDDKSSGTLIGGGLQAVGQVVASGYSVNDHVGTIAVVVKMGRVLMLGPVVLALTLLMNKRNSGATKSNKFPIPIFIIGFFALMIINSLNVLPDIVPKAIVETIGIFLPIAMAGIGMNINLSALKKSGPKIIMAEVFIMAIQVVVLIIGIKILT